MFYSQSVHVETLAVQTS